MPGVCDEIIDDIEDLISSQDITPKERYASRKNVNARSRKKDKSNSELIEKPILESVVPGNLKLLENLYKQYTIFYFSLLKCREQY